MHFNIVIFGTGSTAKRVSKSLNDNVNVIAYLDNNESKWGTKFYNKKVINPISIKGLQYDFIIIASQYNEEIKTQLINMNVEKNKIFEFYKFIDMNFNEFKFKMDKFSNEFPKVETLCTGISYTYLGLKEDVMKKKCFKFALGSQDLYYDYHITKYILKNFRKDLINLKYAIIGLCYYSFQYDMSLSAMKNRVFLYYDILNKSHHFKQIEEKYDENKKNNNIAEKIILRDKNGEYKINWDYGNLQVIYNREKEGEVQSKKDCDKNYQETVCENKTIFRKYLTLLKTNNIKPIIVVFPTSRYYSKYFSKRIENEFHNIINEFKKEYNFQYIDYFRSSLFKDEDFRDVSHLNERGAEKFTKILNDLIEW